MPTIILLVIVLIALIAVGIYWVVTRAAGNEPKSEILDESIDAKRSKGEHVDV